MEAQGVLIARLTEDVAAMTAGRRQLQAADGSDRLGDGVRPPRVISVVCIMLNVFGTGFSYPRSSHVFSTHVFLCWCLSVGSA